MELIFFFFLYLALEALFPEPHDHKKQDRKTKEMYILDDFTELFK